MLIVNEYILEINATLNNRHVYEYEEWTFFID